MPDNGRLHGSKKRMLDEASRRVATHADQLTYTNPGRSGSPESIRRALRHHRLAPSIARPCTNRRYSQPDPTIQTNLDASEVDSNPPKASFNESRWKGFSLRWGAGFLYDYATYVQDDASKAQMDISPLDDLRDFRLLFKGRLPIRGVTYTIGYMYDKVKDDWRFRQTGVMVEVRKAHGNLFVGRTKEGFSTSKIMVGYQGWTNERATINDALISILADGIKWTGGVPNGKLVYVLGYFWNERTQNESFSKHGNSVVGRAVWLPLAGTDEGVLHIALQARHAL